MDQRVRFHSSCLGMALESHAQPTSTCGKRALIVFMDSPRMAPSLVLPYLPGRHVGTLKYAHTASTLRCMHFEPGAYFVHSGCPSANINLVRLRKGDVREGWWRRRCGFTMRSGPVTSLALFPLWGPPSLVSAIATLLSSDTVTSARVGPCTGGAPRYHKHERVSPSLT